MLLLATAQEFAAHDPGRGHPERPERLLAVRDGLARSGLGDDLVPLPARVATRAALERVHSPEYLDRLERACAASAALDPDTVVGPASWPAAELAAGAGLAAVDALEATDGRGAFLAVRPPGHHARPAAAMGFCLLNSAAVCAAELAARGQRVMIADFDAHHGNGTQEMFYERPDVLYLSWHEWPLYPGTGGFDETGRGDGAFTTCNVPLPPGATGDLYLRSFDDLVAPLAERFAPDWLLLSAGFDAHRADPLTGLRLSAGDFPALVHRLLALVRPGRVIAFLEGGYDLAAVRDSVAALAPVLAGDPPHRGEAPTAGGPGREHVDAALAIWRRAGAL